MIEITLLIILLILAFKTVTSDSLIYATIYSGSFSITMALTYLYYSAPDVALAEAAIGVGLSTIMYLVALKKIRAYRIAYVSKEANEFSDTEIENIHKDILAPLEAFIEQTEELEPHLVYSNRPLEETFEEDHDCIIYHDGSNYYFYGIQNDRTFQAIIANLENTYIDTQNIKIMYQEGPVKSHE